MKKFCTVLLGLFLLSTTVALANSVVIPEGQNRSSAYGSGKAWDNWLSGTQQSAVRFNTKYTLGNSRASGVACVEDGNGRVLASASVIYIDHPETAKYVTTDMELAASHIHKILDYMPY